MVCSVLGKKYVTQMENDPWCYMPSPHVFITALSSQTTTEFAGCFQILSSSCVLILQGFKHSHAYR